MRNDFTVPHLNEQIEENGFAVIPFADLAQLEELKNFYQGLPEVNAKGTYVTMFNPSYEYRKKVDEKIKELFSAKAKGFLNDYRVLYTNYMVKETGPEGDFPVHQDWTYVDESHFSSYAFWIPMQDVDSSNGALQVVPSSHQYVTALRGPYVHEPFEKFSEKIKTKYSEKVKLKAGEALVWDHRLIHFSLPNLSSSPRLAFTLIMVPEKARVFHCFGLTEKGGAVVEKYAVDSEFYLKYTIGKRPEGVPLVETVEQPAPIFDEEIFKQKSLSGTSYKQQSKQTADYYNQMQDGYNEVYGDTIQAFRPSDKDKLMEHIVSSAGITDGEKVLDAGCGVAGPATWLAQKFNLKISGITISEVQVQQAKAEIEKKKLNDKIEVKQGDYHELTSHFPENTFDKVLFLESLGHAGIPSKVISEAFKVLKPGGCIYIKDFYYKEPNDEYWKDRIQKTIANINRLYSYNTLNLNNTLTALRSLGFEVEFIRKFSFADDISIRQEFETKFGIDIFGGEPEFYPAEWLEIKCLKPNV
jgi:cyclopropane fatty-acyl-phospholipid synthase-like methyltransferase